MLPIAGSILTPGNIGGTRITAIPQSGPDDYESQIFVWCPTARFMQRTVGAPGFVGDEATRTASEVYIRGVKERLAIETHGAAAWVHRRITFRMYGFAPWIGTDGTPHIPYSFNNDQGYLRSFYRISQGADAQIRNQVTGLIFRGEEGNDWLDPTEAQLDRRRIQVVRDERRIITSGNDFGTIKPRSWWCPVNKKLLYDDEQAGGREVSGLLSATDTKSMGDLYIMDIFRNTRQASEQDWLDISCEATLYWHER